MNYTIKALIKAKNETVSAVANKLMLSRPTFDTYIMLYEAGQEIPKKKYQMVFDTLFSNYDIPAVVFSERLGMCSAILSNHESVHFLEMLSRKADQSSYLMEKIRNKLRCGDLDDDFYEFLDVIISHYSEDLFYNLGQYFLMIYGKKEIDNITELQVAYFTNFHKVFKNFEMDAVQYRLSDWIEFKNSCDKAQRRKHIQQMECELQEIKQKEDELRRRIYESRIWGMDF